MHSWVIERGILCLNLHAAPALGPLVDYPRVLVDHLRLALQAVTRGFDRGCPISFDHLADLNEGEPRGDQNDDLEAPEQLGAQMAGNVQELFRGDLTDLDRAQCQTRMIESRLAVETSSSGSDDVSTERMVPRRISNGSVLGQPSCFRSRA
jgi:hypothetical protein